MDAIVLAAGNGERLKGLAARGMKPLLVVDGEAVVARLVRQLHEHREVDRIIVVVSPANSAAVCDVLESNMPSRCDYAVQPEARGTADAYNRGRVAVRGAHVVVLGDNVLETEELHRIIDARGIGVTRYDPEDSRLEGVTRKLNTGEWVEKVPLTDWESGIVWSAAFVSPGLNARAVGEHLGNSLGSLLASAQTYVSVNARDVGDAGSIR